MPNVKNAKLLIPAIAPAPFAVSLWAIKTPTLSATSKNCEFIK